MAIERCPTGIQELDQILRGGVPVGNVVLLAGGPGTGKTTLGLEFLARGADRGEPGLFMSMTEPIPWLERNAREFAFMDPKHVADGLVRFVDLRAILLKLGDGEDLVDAIASILQQHKAKRLVIDSITAICQRLGEPARIRDFVLRLGLSLHQSGCTSLLTSETPPRELRYSMFGVEEFIADGIVFLSEIERHNDLVRTLQVVKMRGTEHSRARFMMDLSEHGISLAPLLKNFGGPASGG